MRRTIGLLVIFFALFASSARADSSLRERLLGAWRITEYAAVGADAQVIYPMGREVQGFIMYTTDGFMSAHLMIPGRPKYASGDINSATSDERAAAAGGYFGYAGSFEVDEAAQIVVHHVKVSLIPNWIGTDQRRKIILDGDRLELRSPGTVLVSGAQRTIRVHWERAR